MRGNITCPTYRSFKGKRRSHNYVSAEKKKQKNEQARACRLKYPPLLIRPSRLGKPLEYEGIEKNTKKECEKNVKVT